MRLRPAPYLFLLALAGCGDDGPADPGPPGTPPRAASLVVLGGAGQTDTAGATFEIPITVEARDSGGAPLEGVPVWFASAYTGESFQDMPFDTTGADGRVEYLWQPQAAAGTYRLRAAAVLIDAAQMYHIVAADTIEGTVLPASVSLVDLAGPGNVFLGEPLDLGTLIVGPVADRWGNRVVLTSIGAQADPPWTVAGTTVRSDEETESTVRLVLNGLPFAWPLMARRDLRELEGGTGGWVCDKEPGAPTMVPGIYTRRREVAATVDSVQLTESFAIWTLYLTATIHDELSDGTTVDQEVEFARPVVDQTPGRFRLESGLEMVRTSLDPLAYEGTTAADCTAWETLGGGPAAHQPFHLSK